MISHKINSIFHYLLLFLVCLLFFFPFIWMLLGSVKSASEVMNPDVFFPQRWLFSNYREAWRYAPFGTFFKNSIIQASTIVVFQIVTSSLAAYSFAKMHYILKKPLFTLFLATMMIPQEATIITNYLTVSRLGLFNTTAAVVAPSLVSVFGIFLLRQYFLNIPDALLESARIDGAGDLRIFFHICLPISGSALATIAIIGFIASWNSYLWPMVVTNSLAMKNVQTGMHYIMAIDDSLKPWNILMAAATILIVPVAVLFVSMQKFYVKGIARVGIK